MEYDCTTAFGANMDFDDDELHTILLEQSLELPAAMIFESDHDLAFQLQMQEALKASAALHHHSSSSPPTSLPQSFQPPDDLAIGIASLLAEDIAKYERERSDRELAETKSVQARDDLARRIHDQAFARDLSLVPDPQWAHTGDYFSRPYGQGSSSSSSSSSAAVPNAEPLRLYFKGLLREETVIGGGGERKTTSAGVGIAICDVRDETVLEMRTPLVCSGDFLSPEVVEVKALILGLETAVSLGIKRLTVFCSDSSLHQYVTGKSIPGPGNIATLVGQVTLLQRKFSYCGPVLVGQKDIKFALKLANEALVSQITRPEASSTSENMKETCAICLEDTNCGKMFAINGCLHRYCYSCMKSHVHVKLVQGILPKCPSEGCKTDLTTEMCKAFLTPELYDIMCQRVKESSIAATERVYCPYPTCSALMSRIEVSVNTCVGGPCRCKRCQGLFCLYCKVPWHNNISCVSYKMSNPSPSAEDAKLKSLAAENLWRQCVKCSQMVELAEGCNHIYCRCGHQFCYICGAEWRNKLATCACPLWDEKRIVRNERNR